MTSFFRRIAAFAPTPEEAKVRRWIYVPYDRLHDGVGPLADSKPEETVVVLMESRAKGTKRPYHRKKLVLLLSAMRHFALEQAERGCKVVYGFSPTSFGDGLLKLQDRWQWKELIVNRPAERELRVELRTAKQAGLRVRAVADTAWLSTTEDFLHVFGDFDLQRREGTQRRYLMDRFYRHMRTKTGYLMEKGKPVGGKWNWDAENRQPYKGQVPVPDRPTFPPDDITREVMELVEGRFPEAFGKVDGFNMPVTRGDAELAWRFALERLLPFFGPWEDAMHTAHPDLFHSMTSATLNLTLLRPRDLVEQTLEAYEAGAIPLQSTEGFIRQLLGWREFMRHLHEATDGYRKLAPSSDADADAPARPSFLDAHRPLPPVYWGVPAGMRCMDTVVSGVIDNGWSHHITRLMVLSNFAMLCGFEPRELCDWFWFGYVDAYDWVVETNVLGMSTFADGGLTATKPYVSGAAYINKMSDFCGKCALDPRKSTGPGSCPFTSLYWTFLERHSAVLERNPRMQMPLRTLGKMAAPQREAMRERAAEAIGMIERGERIR